MSSNYHVALALLLLATAAPAVAQPIYRQSWTMQEKEFGLRQDLARFIISSANDYLTRDDPNGQVARLDDRLRVTVIGEIMPSTGTVSTRLERLVMGTVVVDRGFEGFLDPPTLSRLVRRDYFWRDETIDVFNVALSPVAASMADSTLRQGAGWRFTGSENPVPRLRVAVDETTVRIGASTRLFVGLGMTPLSLPDAAYGRARIGVDLDGIRAWGECPAPIGSVDSRILARGLDGQFGMGVSFESQWLGALVSGTIGSATYGDAGSRDGRRYTLQKAAILYGRLPLPMPGDDDLIAYLYPGLGYRQIDTRQPLQPGESPLADPARLFPTVTFDFHLRGDKGRPLHSMFITLVDESLTLRYEVSIYSGIGLRLVAAQHGLFGRRDPWLAETHFSISPTFTIW